MLALLATGAAAGLQAQRAPARVGMLILAAESSVGGMLESFRGGLREVGLVEGRNLELTVASASGEVTRLPALAAQLVARRVDVIVTGGGNASTRAARDATRTIPIVMSSSVNAVEEGLVSSLSRPGGNVTGMTIPLDLAAKQIQFLRELVPGLARLAVLVREGEYSAQVTDNAVLTAQHVMGLQLQFVSIRSAADLPRALERIRAARTEALMIGSDPLIYQVREAVQAFAGNARIATMTPTPDMVEAGALVSYGPNVHEFTLGAARFVDRILRGAAPQDLPVEQPARLELVINARVARALGLKLTPALLARADRVVD